MDSSELIDIALRVLSAIDHGRQPDEADVSLLRSHAQPDETGLSIEELADAIIGREIEKRRAARGKR